MGWAGGAWRARLGRRRGWPPHGRRSWFAPGDGTARPQSKAQRAQAQRTSGRRCSTAAGRSLRPAAAADAVQPTPRLPHAAAGTPPPPRWRQQGGRCRGWCRRLRRLPRGCRAPWIVPGVRAWNRAGGRQLDGKGGSVREGQDGNGQGESTNLPLLPGCAWLRAVFICLTRSFRPYESGRRRRRGGRRGGGGASQHFVSFWSCRGWKLACLPKTTHERLCCQYVALGPCVRRGISFSWAFILFRSLEILFIQHISSEGAKKVLHTAKWPALPLPQAVWGVRFMVLDGT